VTIIKITGTITDTDRRAIDLAILSLQLILGEGRVEVAEENET
jgi:hypothetical protein